MCGHRPRQAHANLTVYVRFWRENDPWFAPSLEFDLLRKPKRIVYLYSEVANCRFDLCVSEQKLHCPEVPSLSIELRHFGSSQRVSAKHSVIEANGSYPPMDDASVLPGGDVRAPASTAQKQVAFC